MMMWKWRLVCLVVAIAETLLKLDGCRKKFNIFSRLYCKKILFPETHDVYSVSLSYVLSTSIDVSFVLSHVLTQREKYLKNVIVYNYVENCFSRQEILK